MANERLPFDKTRNGIVAAIRLTPKARRDTIAGIAERDDGRVVLKVAVSAVPEKGKANAALLKLLSKTRGVGMRSLRLISGSKNRNKAVLISGEPDHLYAMLAQWAKSLSKGTKP